MIASRCLTYSDISLELDVLCATQEPWSNASSVQKFYFQEISHAEAGVKARAAPVERVAAIRKLWLFGQDFGIPRAFA